MMLRSEQMLWNNNNNDNNDDHNNNIICLFKQHIMHADHFLFFWHLPSEELTHTSSLLDVFKVPHVESVVDQSGTKGGVD